jgi:hypothetical protein
LKLISLDQHKWRLTFCLKGNRYELQSREKLIRADTRFLKKLLNKCEKQNAITVVERFENPASRNGEVPMDTSPRVQQHEAFQQAQPVPPHQTESVSSRREGIPIKSIKYFLVFLMWDKVHVNVYTNL